MQRQIVMMSVKDDLTRVILFRLDQATRAAKQYSQRAFDQADLDITVEQWVLLKIIEQFSPLSQRELAKQSLRDPASITRTLDLLQKKDYVQRAPIEKNRRQYNIYLTEHGASFVKTHMAMVKLHRAKSLDGLSDHDIQHLSNMLETIRKNMK